jgi:hypothetical protein
MNEHRIVKVLSANDTGETGGHQAGLLIPRQEEILSFFPKLDSAQLNPRAHLHFEDQEGKFWEFAFIYYIREAGLATGDEVTLQYAPDGGYFISYQRETAAVITEQEEGGTVLRLGSGWKVIDL